MSGGADGPSQERRGERAESASHGRNSKKDGSLGGTFPLASTDLEGQHAGFRQFIVHDLS